MIGYVSRYTPVEVLEAFGIESAVMELDLEHTAGADEYIRNVCGYAKAVLLAGLRGGYEALVLPGCCESLRRVADVLEQEAGVKIYRLALPKVSGEEAERQFAREVKGFIQRLAVDTGKGFDMECFVAAIARGKAEPPHEHIAALGACLPDWVTPVFEVDGTISAVDYSCSNMRRHFDDVNARGEDGRSVIDWYAAQLLCQLPVLHAGETDRARVYAAKGTEGILHHSAAHCDFYGMAQAEMGAHLPELELETEFSASGRAQAASRIQSFLESNGWLAGALAAGSTQPKRRKRNGYYVGIDSGSASTNAVILDVAGNIVAKGSLSTGEKCQQSAKILVDVLLKQKGIDRSLVCYTVATGYGRNVLPDIDRDITEITCHAKGASHIFPGAATVIDVGGQDCKVIKLDGEGGVTDFLMNDKCAAGTGRFMEMMAEKLGIPINGLGAAGQAWEKDVSITSTCAVFAESEVVSLLAEGTAIADIVHGINGSVANKLLAMAVREDCSGPFVMTGGVAQNADVVSALSERLGEAVLVPEEPQLTGALGAALFALESV